MGWTVLYIAFGVVALWLLGEVLLQYKARLRWRVLAFCGFLGVVLGVLLPSVAVIVAGAVAFAVGQTYVTLSFRRGFSTGWAIGGNPGASRRRRSGSAAQAGPTLQVTDLSYGDDDTAFAAHGTDDAAAHPADTGAAAVYEPEPLPEDTGQYGIYDGGHTAAAGYGTGYDPYAPGYDQPSHDQPAYDQTGYPQPSYEQQPAYDYGAAGQQQYATYSDPYIGPGADGQQYAPYYADPYAPSYTYDTPPGGVWVPQQRDNEPDPHQQQQAPSPYGYEPHPDDQQQYRY
ncbi:hypothetical protein ACFVZH_03800 [Streptomyces sp. NPDC059534]|uniref:hypothetical protein n=1 Tax=Streptomyces sp. NPDC059534 TaxID=3346859 RepID=UPI0036CD3566